MNFLWSGIEPCALPNGALLTKYAEAPDCYTDCYTTNVATSVDLSDFVAAFYTTKLFKLERLILRFAASRPSTDAQAQEFGLALIDRFAAWRVEKRNEKQLLMCDYSERTRSWLMVVTDREEAHGRTRLYFGSAVVPTRSEETGTRSLGWVFNALLAFHRLYSKALLSAAQLKLERQFL